MAEYRAYVIGSDGHIASATGLVCKSDDEANRRGQDISAGADHRNLERRQVRYPACP
jgi:hypothetical protein